MKFTLNWLKEYINIDISAQQLADKLTMLGLEVDSVDELCQDIKDIKVCRIKAVLPHPDADKLTLCDLDIGESTTRVVCGAPNAREGMVTAIALPGTVLPSGLQVKEAKIRGQKSSGMLCSEKELGISEDHTGIMDIPDSVAPGSTLVQALLLTDTLIEVDLTPNRPDCASVIGIAREVAGFTGQKIKLPIQEPLPQLDGKAQPFAIEIEAPDECPRYAARLLKNVKIGPSPWWLKKRLVDIGLRPINNIVDITNLVMMEFGQPLHAFDYRKISGPKIIVRKAVNGEKFITLDETEHELDSETLLICDADKPVAIAGVMGGMNSEVSDETIDVLLESACFNPINIRRTARQLNMATDASYRFERGTDIEGVPKAMDRAVNLMADLADAEIVTGGIDSYINKKETPSIKLRPFRTSSLLGINLKAEQIASTLEAIEMNVVVESDELLTVHPPSFRVDIEREVDLVEEVARLIGFNEIPTALPKIPMSFPEQDKYRTTQQRLSSLMTSLSFNESINYSFTSERNFDLLELSEESAMRLSVHLRNPLTEDQKILRTTLLPGLLENVQRNVNRQNYDIRLYEIGKTFVPDKDNSSSKQPIETTHLAGVLSGRRIPNSPVLYFGSSSSDFFDTKGTVEAIVQELRIPDVLFENNPNANKHFPGYVHHQESLTVKSGKRIIGMLGKIKPSVLKSFGIKQDVFFFDIEIDKLIPLEKIPIQFKSLPKFPAVKWDIALLVPENTEVGNILSAINTCNEPLVENVEIFDIYRGKPIENGYKSVAVSVTYRSDKQTLDDKTVDKTHQNILKMINSKFNARLREVQEG